MILPDSSISFNCTDCGYRDLGHTFVVVNATTGEIFELAEELEIELLRKIVGGSCIPQELAAAIATEYEISPNLALDDCMEYLDELLNAKLIIVN